MMDFEPFIIRQTAEPKTPAESWRWFKQASNEARRDGATFARYSVNDAANPTIFLFEAWRTRPKDEGEPRFSLEFDE